MPDAETIIQGRSEQSIWNVFSSGDDKFHGGIWGSRSGCWSVSYSEEAFCLILEGESIIHDGAGNTKRVVAEDQFVVPPVLLGAGKCPTTVKSVRGVRSLTLCLESSP